MNQQQMLDRIEELENLLGMNLKLPNALGFTPTEMKFLGMLVRRDIVSHEGMHIAVYGGLPENRQPDMKIVDVYLCRLRKKLRPRGHDIKNHFGVGWYIEPESRAALKEMCAA